MLATTPTAVASEVFARLQDAWNAADGTAFGTEFTDDADFVDIRGDHHRGRPAIAEGHDAILRSIYAGSTVTFEVESVRPIAPGAVVAVVGAELDAPAGPLAGTNRSHITAVLVEGGGNWAITSFHNTQQAADPQR